MPNSLTGSNLGIQTATSQVGMKSPLDFGITDQEVTVNGSTPPNTLTGLVIHRLRISTLIQGQLMHHRLTLALARARAEAHSCSLP